MSKICYVEKTFTPAHLDMIEKANGIVEDYQSQGYNLTLRQLYYQFVSRDWIANTVQNYKRLGSIVNDARLAGLIDWNAIEDRTRGIDDLPSWDAPNTIVNACADQFRIDKWATQPNRIELWVEKEALAGVFERVCHSLQVPFLSCRGYTSQSEVWRAAMRLRSYMAAGQDVHIIHFGDHDPSGIDMSRDIQDRMRIFGVDLNFERVALNMDQVSQYNPPPNPAKTTDSRFAAYMERFGDESWELDALEPKILAGIAQKRILALRDKEAWEDAVAEETEGREQLKVVADNWQQAVDAVQ